MKIFKARRSEFRKRHTPGPSQPPAEHNHDSEYAPLDHSHSQYALVGHTHGSDPINDAALEVNALGDAFGALTGDELAQWNYSTGILGVRQYNYARPFEPERNVSDVNFAAITAHDHPNTDTVVGLGELAMIINGQYLRVRHQDYRMRRNGVGGIPENNEWPEMPASVAALPTGVNSDGTIDDVNDTQARYMRNVYTDNPQDVQWCLSYCEFWFETVSGEIPEEGDSPRHAELAEDIDAAYDLASFFRAAAHKDRLENSSHFQVKYFRINGELVPCIPHFRIMSQPIGTLAQYPTSDFEIVKDLRTKRIHNQTWDWYARTRLARFRHPNLQEFCEMVPGLDGEGAVLEETFQLPNGSTDTFRDYIDGDLPLNAAYYNRRYRTENTGAAGRQFAHRGFNDSSLYVARTSRPEVVNGYSYMFPLEMVLRSPIHAWNPMGVVRLPREEVVAHAGTEEDPYPGEYGGRYFLTPFLFYGDMEDADDPADTNWRSYVTVADGSTQQMWSSGQRIMEPGSRPDRQRLRWPVYPLAQEFSYESTQFENFKHVLKDLLRGQFPDIDEAF